MSADKTVSDAATVTLVAATAYTIRFTRAQGGYSEVAEIIHHGNVSDVVFYQVKATEEQFTAASVGGNEYPVLMPSERLTLRMPWRTGFYVRLISGGAPQVTIDASEK